MPHSAPMMIEPVSQAPPKPQAAPTIIMPSTPRLSTPARSVTQLAGGGEQQRRRGRQHRKDDGLNELHWTPLVTRK